jgi:hypothetical protein
MSVSGNQKLSLLFTIFLILNLIIIHFANTFDDQIENVENKLELSIIQLPDTGTRASSYTYHNYTQMVEALHDLNSNYSGLMDLDSAQDLFGVPDCRDGYKIWIVRITNESITRSKPEVLYVGGYHGDEDISIEVPFYFISWLLESYDSDPKVRYIIDNRDLYIIPVLNPYGWENDDRMDGNGEDMNRDYPYGNLTSNPALTTVGSRTVHELMKVHLFSAGITWHAGAVGIYYAWGTPLHNTLFDESPDDMAFKSVGERMSEYAGSFQGEYNFGPANQLIYEADGAWSDYAYAASWDTDNKDPAHPTNGARTLAFGVEISNQDRPAESELGTSVDLYCTPQQVKGLIPKNIRLGFILAELAEPYAIIQNKSLIPQSMAPGEELVLSWEAGGAINIDQTSIQYGQDSNPMTSFEFSTPVQAGKTECIGKIFSQNLTMPEVEGDYYFTIRVSADSVYSDQLNPEPVVEPQSVYVNHRINDTWELTNAGITIEGQIDYYSEIFKIEVKAKPVLDINLLDYPETGFVNENVVFRWSIDNTVDIHSQLIHRSKNPGDIQNSTHSISEGINEINNSTVSMFEVYTILPDYWGYYYYQIEVYLNETRSLLSEIMIVFVNPKLDITDGPDLLKIYEVYSITYKLEGVKELFNVTTQLTEGFIFTDPAQEDLIFTNRSEGVFNRTLVAPFYGGLYSLRIIAYFKEFQFFSGHHTFTVQDGITIFKYNLNYESMNSTLTITDLDAVCSNQSHLQLTPNNTLVAEIIILTSTNETVYRGNLSWSETASWHINSIDVSSWPKESYFIIPVFNDGKESTGIGRENIFTEEIEITPYIRPDGENGDKKENDENKGNLGLYYVIITAFVVVAIIMITAYFKKKTISEDPGDRTDFEEDESSDDKKTR